MCLFSNTLPQLATKLLNFEESSITAITLFKVIQGHRFWHRLKAHMQLSNFSIND